MSSANDRQVGGAHYNPGAVAGFYQHWDFVVDVRLPYLEAQATRYIDRHQKKNGRQDLEKALHYIQKLQECLAEARAITCGWGYPDPERLDLYFNSRPEMAPNDIIATMRIVKCRGTADLDDAASAVRASIIQFYGK